MFTIQGIMTMLAFIGLLLVIVWIFKQPAVKGKCGEWGVALVLKRLDKNVYTVLNNVLLPDDKGGTTQIDHLVLSPYGVFVIETKNMKGWIFGDTDAAMWTQTLFRKKHQFQNPFRQNYKHIMTLATCTQLAKETFEHIIVFVGDCTLKTRDKLPDSLLGSGGSLLRYIRARTENVVTPEILAQIQSALPSVQVANTRKNTQAHVEHVKQIIESKNVPETPLCPNCGAAMVERVAKTGVRVGERFWGCPHYPKCRGHREKL